MAQAQLKEDYLDYKHAIFNLYNYKPHEKQCEIHNSDARFIVAVCGRRFGKSKLAAKEIEFVTLDSTTSKRVWTVGATNKIVEKVFRELWQDIVTGYIEDGEKIPPLVSAGSIIKKAYNEQSHYIKFAWGSEIVGLTTKNEESLLGDEVDLLVLDEAARIKQRVWERELRPTLTSRRGKALFITTPQGKNWIYDRFRRGQEPNNDWDSFKYTSAENPYGDVRNDIESAREDLTEETFKQEYLADFVSFAGQVYKSFDVGIHVTDKIPDRFDDVIVGLDHGYVNPTAMIVFGIRDGRYYGLEEVYKRGMLLSDIKTELTRLKKDYHFSKVYADHKPEYNKPLNAAGYKVINAKKDVAAGIEKVSQKLKPYKDGKPLLRLRPRCVNTISEFEGYEYPEKKANQNDKEEPTKLNDHAVDATRYAIFTHETKPVTKFIQRTGVYG